MAGLRGLWGWHLGLSGLQMTAAGVAQKAPAWLRSAAAVRVREKLRVAVWACSRNLGRGGWDSLEIPIKEANRDLTTSRQAGSKVSGALVGQSAQSLQH